MIFLSKQTCIDCLHAFRKMLYFCLNTGWRKNRVIASKDCHYTLAPYCAKLIFKGFSLDISSKFAIKYDNKRFRRKQNRLLHYLVNQLALDSLKMINDAVFAPPCTVLQLLSGRQGKKGFCVRLFPLSLLTKLT